MLVLELFTLFDTFLVQYLLRDAFNTPKKVNIIELKGLHSFIFKVQGLKRINVSDRDEFQFCVKVQGLKTYLTLDFICMCCGVWA